VAEFVSFGPGRTPAARFGRIRGDGGGGDVRLGDVDVEGAVARLFASSSAKAVNVRSFRPAASKGNPFEYGVARVADAAALVRRHAAAGYYTIVNETIDVNDGGVSGVLSGGVVEFAPGDTPRAVEKSGTTALPHDRAIELLSTVYGFRPEVDDVRGERLEFSVHPLRVGYRRTHTVLWERAVAENGELPAALSWPNRFSRFLGDKTFGLLIASIAGFPVPHTRVVARRVAPFEFGRPTGTGERWLRTSPAEPTPGKFTTRLGWTDPFELLTAEDPRGTRLSSVLAQEAVDATHSGAAFSGGGDGAHAAHVEGVTGRGDRFMLGRERPEALPGHVTAAVREATAEVAAEVGPVRLEWAFDGRTVWVLQVRLMRGEPSVEVINPGRAGTWLSFDPDEGLDRLALLVREAAATGGGVRVSKPVGITSHVGDILRRAGVPAMIDPSGAHPR
jgi:hypothetical protein